MEEQETHVWIDYLERKVFIYTNRASAYRRLLRKIGKPKKINYIKGKIVGGTWEISFENKKLVSSVLTKSVLVGSFK